MLVNSSNSIKVKVWDQLIKVSACGKRVNDPTGWYTPVTGIWQTVWLEPVPETYIKDLKITHYRQNLLIVEAIQYHQQRVEVRVKKEPV